jgi:hypothetical protein
MQAALTSTSAGSRPPISHKEMYFMNAALHASRRQDKLRKVGTLERRFELGTAFAAIPP